MIKLSRSTLHTRARPCKFHDPSTNLGIAEDMIRLMRQERGIGLAATQCGLGIRLFVMEVDGEVIHAFNPSVIDTPGPPSTLAEGCLSFPGQTVEITRPGEILVRYQDHNGAFHERTLSGLAAHCYQHELDHLDGITMFKRQRLNDA